MEPQHLTMKTIKTLLIQKQQCLPHLHILREIFLKECCGDSKYMMGLHLNVYHTRDVLNWSEFPSPDNYGCL